MIIDVSTNDAAAIAAACLLQSIAKEGLKLTMSPQNEADVAHINMQSALMLQLSGVSPKRLYELGIGLADQVARNIRESL